MDKLTSAVISVYATLIERLVNNTPTHAHTINTLNKAIPSLHMDIS